MPQPQTQSGPPTSFQPLSQQQYQSAISAGFSPQQIIQNEQQRKASSIQPAQSSFANNQTIGSAGQATLPSGTPGAMPNQPLGNVGYNLQQAPGGLYKAITTLFPGKQLGSDIGDSLYGASQAISQHSMAPIAQADQEINSNFKNTVGDVTQAVTTPATLAMGGGEGATAVGRVVNAALKYGAGGAVSNAANTVAQGDSNPGDVGQSALTGGLFGALTAGGLQGAGEAASGLSQNSDIQKIVQKLMPNVRSTGPEVRAAMDDGRIIDGTKSTFWGSTPDTIAPRDKAITNAQTLQKNIPGVADMSPQNTVRAIDNKTDSLAEALQPVMKSTPISQLDTGKVFDAWKNLKASQSEVPAFLDAPSNARFQNQFERYLGNLQWDITGEGGQFKAPTPKTLDDVWQTQKQYDASVPEDVKNLGPNADRIDKLQNRMWLQNRTLLTSLRDDLASRLAPDVQSTFKDMSNMYDARRAIVKNAKIDTKGSQGLLTKGLLKGAGLIGTGLGLGTGAGLLGEHLLNSTSQ